MRRHSTRPLPDIKQNPDKNASQRKRKKQSAPPGIENSPRVSQLKKFQHLADNSHKVQKLAQFQRMADKHVASQEKPLQLKSAEDKIIEKKNHTGLPDNLKTGIENLSGLSMDDVKVHYNSEKPAQLHAHAYAQGTDIHLAAGQEKHLPHEAWHVVQQKQGRVQPTMQMKGTVNVNDDAGLEREADVMGAKAVQLKLPEGRERKTANPAIQSVSYSPARAAMESAGNNAVFQKQPGTVAGLSGLVVQRVPSIGQTVGARIIEKWQEHPNYNGRLNMALMNNANVLPNRV